MVANKELLIRLKNLVKGAGRISFEQASTLLNTDIKTLNNISTSLSDDYTIIKEGDKSFFEYTNEYIDDEVEEPVKKEAKAKTEIKQVIVKPLVKKQEKKSFNPIKALIQSLIGKRISNSKLNNRLRNFLNLLKSSSEEAGKFAGFKAEQEILSEMLININALEKDILYNEDKFNGKISELESKLDAINNYTKKMKQLDIRMSDISRHISEHSKKVNKSIESLKKNAELFKDLESKLELDKKSIFENLKKVKSELGLESKKISEKISVNNVPAPKAVEPKKTEEVKPKIVFKAPEKKEGNDKIVDVKVKPVHAEKPKTAEKQRVIEKVKVEEKKILTQEKIKKFSEKVIDEALNEDTEKSVLTKDEGNSKRFVTDIDKVLALVKEKGKISFQKISKLFNEKMSTIEGWCEALEDKGFVEIVYPLLGAPYIKYKGGKNE